MTESATVAKSLSFAKNPFKTKSGACGTVIRNADMKVVDTITGVSLPRNKSGEICIRGDQLMKGYLNDPEATARTIDNDGWLHTGDIGYVDDDDEIFIVDRLKELIKFKGYQVAPAELEALLISHPYIEDAAVVAMKDEVAGEVPVAFVVSSEGSQVTEDDVTSYICKQVVHYKRVNMVFFTDYIPKAPSGKILRKDLRARLANGLMNLSDLRNKGDIEKLFSKQRFDAVIHFAGLKAVGESVGNPRRYFYNNLVGTINLYETMAKHNCKMVRDYIHVMDLADGHIAALRKLFDDPKIGSFSVLGYSVEIHLNIISLCSPP
ncbi:hypothetical protein DY000_02004690 [Brassica cretica]|uniref:AMP-dependent synthetase/ligase domain-containing protein n=1 Tax=Brassica cretica TaxID=69181 RepID=A0ABQ7CLG7_BRACR|nr:hypothetical protein DY000_02004690 [Brassica cretica]